ANSSNHLEFLRTVQQSVLGVDTRRELPPFPGRTFEQLFHVEHPPAQATIPNPGVAMLADTFTNYGTPERGMAAVRVLRAVGLDVALTPCLPDGRAAMSQGMIATARQQARALAAMLQPYLDNGKKIVVVEPSVLAMLRFDNRHLLEDQSLVAALAANSFEPLQLLWDVAREHGIDLAKLFPAAKSRFGTRLFYHAHCQQRTCNASTQTIDVLRAAGFDVATSSVECCGMAGSFGYKHDYYELSMAVGADLFAQARSAEQEGGLRVLVASGVSCHEQISAGMGRAVLHPAEVLLSTLQE
ncbi:MAG TPA: (4Fe-4S)-binding protein, partial [Candidatus Angelobacter sp.]|nr:(4Fe-4S)-binding protein [Candidatus Angelobacter sp.]